MSQNIVFTNDIDNTLDNLLAAKQFSRLAVVVDTNTAQAVLPLIECQALKQASVIAIGPGDINKNLDTLVDVWKKLEAMGATRKSLVVNLGGGVVTDLGGFAAATYKRGIPLQDRHQLQRAEKRNRLLRGSHRRHHYHTIFHNTACGRAQVGLCRDAEAQHAQQSRRL